MLSHIKENQGKFNAHILLLFGVEWHSQNYQNGKWKSKPGNYLIFLINSIYLQEDIYVEAPELETNDEENKTENGEEEQLDQTNEQGNLHIL